MRPALSLSLFALLTACGSTVSLTGQVVSGGGSTDVAGLNGAAPSSSGASTSTYASTAGDASTGGSRADGTTPAAGSATSDPAAAGGTTSTGGGASATSLPATGRGWDAKFVYIGLVTEKDAQKAFAAFGANNIDPGDSEAQANAVANYLNSRGGLFGRQVKMRFKDVATVNTATNPDSTGASVCTYFSQDHPVVAVISIVTVMDVPSFRSCLARSQIPLFSAGVKAVDDGAVASFGPYFYQLMAVSWNSLAPALASRLKTQGWFGGWDTTLGRPGVAKTKVGILIDGTDVGTRVGKVVKRALADVGHPDSVVYQYSDASQGQQSSVLYFKGNGVTHVIVTDVELTAFQISARNQNYKPRFGITSYNDPYSNLESSGLTPAGANNGAMGVGYAPGLDVSQANDPGSTPGSRTCMDQMAKAGQKFNGKRLAVALASAICDGIILAVRGAIGGGGLSGTAIYEGILKLGPTYSPATGFAAALTTTKHFVPGVARDLAWIGSCSCFKYGPGRTSL